MSLEAQKQFCLLKAYNQWELLPQAKFKSRYCGEPASYRHFSKDSEAPVCGSVADLFCTIGRMLPYSH